MNVANRIASLDLLRGIPIALVMARHAAPDLFPGAGVVGVVMFFSLSGYLITGVLLRELDRTESVRLTHFYRRRALRLAPAMVAWLVGITLVTLALDPLHERKLLGATWLVSLTWTANLPFRPVFSDAGFHLWTLATEEQFYLIWPALLLIGARLGQRWLAFAVAAVVSAGLLVATAYWFRNNPDQAYVLPTSWAICFVIGGLARWLTRGRASTSARPPRGAVAWVVCGSALLAGLAVLPLRGELTTYLVVGPLVAAVTAALAQFTPHWPAVPRWADPLRRLGVISYAAYLWNYPLALWLRPYGWGGAVTALLLTVVIATASWRWVEEPVARWQAKRWRQPAPAPRRETVPW
ncbi:acyltransferase family protein [Nocardioides sp. Bht2]|uniref:acyltransferase family protein n=1 Tax=Nocardioides sp. Bht2 TaxID=3392297 RepID=UPI0039B3FA5D